MTDHAFQKGNNQNIDLIVSDIYGHDSNNLGLPPDLIASSLGKLGKMTPEELSTLNDDDICRSILLAFAINIGILSANYLKNEGIESCIVVGDKLHNKYFYLAIQVNYFLS